MTHATTQHYPIPGQVPDYDEHEPDCDCAACDNERALDDVADAYAERCND